MLKASPRTPVRGWYHTYAERKPSVPIDESPLPTRGPICRERILKGPSCKRGQMPLWCHIRPSAPRDGRLRKRGSLCQMPQPNPHPRLWDFFFMDWSEFFDLYGDKSMLLISLMSFIINSTFHSFVIIYKWLAFLAWCSYDQYTLDEKVGNLGRNWPLFFLERLRFPGFWWPSLGD